MVQPSGFGMCVLDSQEEFMMTINSKYLVETNNSKFEKFCKSLLLWSKALDVHFRYH